MATLNELTIDGLIDNFEFLGDWEERFSYVLDLGKRVPPMDEADLVEANKVHGCQSQVWLKSWISDDGEPRFRFIANSDAHIVNGLIAILMVIHDDKPVSEVLDTNAAAILKRMDLEEHLSPTRRNGLHAMVKRIRAAASAAAEGVN